VAFGHLSLYSNTASSNTAVGFQTMYANTSGTSNVASGSEALYNNSTGSNNVAMGLRSLFTNTTGSNNTAVGFGADVSTASLTNATAIGFGAVVNASNKVRIGNASVTVIEGQVAFTNPSDGRFKTNVTETVQGLSFINMLRPVVYNFQSAKYESFINGGIIKASNKDFEAAERVRQSGFIAQEVEQAARATGYDFNGIISPKDEQQTYSLSYSQFVVPLVKAVQELSQQNEIKEKEIAAQQAQIDELKKQMEEMSTLLLNTKK
jgi:trimeric autotransporter adhesin